LKLRTITVKDFRNFHEAEACFSPGLNVICGENGQGKTSLIESIYVVSSGKSFRTKDSIEMIRNSSEYSTVDAEVEKNGLNGGEKITDKYRIFISAEKKLYMINGCKASSEDFYGNFGCVLMSDRDMLILRGNPEERRKFIDRAVSNTDKLYLSALLRYNRILRQRNALLRRARETRLPISRLKEELEAWNSQLVEAADEIMIKREMFVEKLRECVCESYRSLFGSAENLIMTYEPSVKKKLMAMLWKFRQGCWIRWNWMLKEVIPA
jgi:DNA replication and repair protein RecF